jgi:hypothetical protein
LQYAELTSSGAQAAISRAIAGPSAATGFLNRNASRESGTALKAIDEDLPDARIGRPTISLVSKLISSVSVLSSNLPYGFFDSKFAIYAFIATSRPTQLIRIAK